MDNALAWIYLDLLAERHRYRNLAVAMDYHCVLTKTAQGYPASIGRIFIDLLKDIQGLGRMFHFC